MTVAAGTRDRLIRAALTQFADKGYGATSIQDILRQAEVHPGSLYHAFPTKQDLLLAVLRTYCEGIHPMLLAPAWRGVRDPIERIFALLARYRSALVATDCFYGCPIGSLALELHEPDPPVRKLLAANFDQWIRAVEQCLRDAGPRIPRGVDRRGLAAFVLATMEGAVMQGRTIRAIAPFDAVIAQLRDYFTRLEAAAGAPPSRTRIRTRTPPLARRHK